MLVYALFNPVPSVRCISNLSVASFILDSWKVVQHKGAKGKEPLAPAPAAGAAAGAAGSVAAGAAGGVARFSPENDEGHIEYKVKKFK